MGDEVNLTDAASKELTGLIIKDIRRHGGRVNMSSLPMSHSRIRKLLGDNRLAAFLRSKADVFEVEGGEGGKERFVMIKSGGEDVAGCNVKCGEGEG